MILIQKKIFEPNLTSLLCLGAKKVCVSESNTAIYKLSNFMTKSNNILEITNFINRSFFLYAELEFPVYLEKKDDRVVILNNFCPGLYPALIDKFVNIESKKTKEEY
jgi:hypothetical protein